MGAVLWGLHRLAQPPPSDVITVSGPTVAGLRERFVVIVGGTPVTDAWAEEIGADSWAENAMQAVTVLEKVMALRRGNASATV